MRERGKERFGEERTKESERFRDERAIERFRDERTRDKDAYQTRAEIKPYLQHKKCSHYLG